jgi:hypothetical protein
MTSLHFDYGHMTIQQLVNHFEQGQLNLEPSFQRNSVWSPKDRSKLIESILSNYPIPSIFLYKNKDNRGRLVYDVIDGKQRLESIFMFMGLGRFRRQRFEARLQLSETDEEGSCNWTRISRNGGDYAFNAFRIQTVEIAGEFNEIVRVFVLINSTGKKLNSAEKRKAQFCHSDFLKLVAKLSERYKLSYVKSRILSKGAVERMKHVELTCELVASIAGGGPLNKKKALDAIISGRAVEGKRLRDCVKEFVRTTNLITRMFPRLKETRFANAVDYYSLFLLVWELDRAGCILNNGPRNRQAENLLVWLTLGVDEVRGQQRKAVGAAPDQRIFADYLMTIQGDTDSQSTRERRSNIIRALLSGIYARKDNQRIFSPEQRRLIWHSDGTKRCSHPGCSVVLNWTNFTIDHVKPFAKGGKTTNRNAALMCKKHNSSKRDKWGKDK